jgi:ankyrin repeat protein
MNYAKYVKYVFLVLFMTSTFTHAGNINPGTKTITDIANTIIQSEISVLKKRYKDKFNILYEDMSRKGQLNGTSMLDRLSKLCFDEIDDYALLIHNTLLRVFKDSGVSYSDELAAELKNIVKGHLTGEIGSISGYIKQKNKFGPTLTNQLSIKETELNNKRTNELKKINSGIDLRVTSFNNQEKEAVRTDRVSNKFINLLQTHWVVSLITFISALLGIFSFFRRRQKINISSTTVIDSGVKGDVVEGNKIQGDKVFGDKISHQEQKSDASSSFQERLSFIEAAKEGNVSAIELLLVKGVDVNTTDRDGNTALIWAARHGQRDCVRKLIEKGSKVNVKNNVDWTALIAASRKGHKAVVELLIENGADVNAKANDGNTAFTFASAKGYDEIVDILKKSGAVSVKYQDPKILTAAFNGDVNTLKALLEKGVSPNTIDRIGGETPLMYAMGRNHFECAKLLLEFGADVNIRDKDGHTVLDVIKGRPEMLELIEIYGTKRQ